MLEPSNRHRKLVESMGDPNADDAWASPRRKAVSEPCRPANGWSAATRQAIFSNDGDGNGLRRTVTVSYNI